MKKRLHYFGWCCLAFVLVSANIMQAQTTVQIGFGTSAPTNTLYSPVYRFDAASTTTTCQSNILFTAAELSTAGVSTGDMISAIAFNKLNANNFLIPAQFTIRMANSTKTPPLTGTIATEWASILATHTTVYTDNSFNLPNVAGWATINLTTPFMYTGGSLEISTDQIMTGGATGATGNFSWQYTPGFETSIIGATTGNSNLATYKFRPNIQITVAPSGPCTSPPAAGTATATPSSGLCTGANVQLNITGNSTGVGQTYQWEESFTPGGPFSPIAGATSTNTTIQANSTMYYRAAVTCNSITSYSTEVLVTVPPAFPGGIYTINSALPTGSGNFQTFADAVAAISCGIAGPIVFNVAPSSGPYNEQIILPATIGSTATNTVTFNGNGRTLGFASANTNQRAVITLNGADYVTIDSLIINANAGTYGWGVHFINGADFNTISRCTINTSTSNATAYNFLPIVMSGSATTPIAAGNSGNNNLITGNTLIGGYYNLILYGNSVTNAPCVNNTVSNNIMTDAYSYATYVIYQGGAVVSGNDISRPTRTTSTTTAGVFLTTGCLNTLVEKNRIHNMYDAITTNAGTIYGIYVATGTTATLGNENKIYNNAIYNINHIGPIYGIYNSGGAYMKAYHNTISLDHTPATGGATYGMYQVTTAAGIEYRNNMITIARGGSGLKYGFYFSTAGSTHTSNNNNVFLNSAGTGLQYYGYYGGTNYVTLANWQTANGGIYDPQSQNANPIYANAAGGDFTFTNLSIDNLGAPVGVTTDIMNNPRDPVVPDIGAFEVPNSPCTSPPTAGTASATPNTAICGGANIFLNLTGISSGSGQTYQWEESFTPGGPFSPVTAVLQSPGTNITATTSKYYRAAVTCGASTSYSTEVFVNVGAIAGTASSSQSSVCFGNAVNLLLSGHTGNNIQWEAFDNGTSSWVSLVGATTASYLATNMQATTNFRAAVSCSTPAGTVYSNTFTVIVDNPQIVEAFPGSRCNAGPVTLAARAATGVSVKWYAAPTGGTSLGTGGAFTTPSISSNTTYYAAASTGGTQTVGPNDPSIGTYAGWNAVAQWLNFTVISTTTIQTVDMFFSAAVNTPFSVVIRDATTLANVHTHNDVVTVSNAAPTVAQVVPINATLPPGNYQMNVGAVVATFRNSTGAVYPYAIPGVISITGNTFDPLYYYMFYRWVVGAGCEGTRVPVTATINGTSSGTGLSTGGTTILNSHPASTAIDYMDACNDRVATVTNNPVALGNTAAIVLTSPTIQTFNNRPYVPRVFDITPTTNGSATVTLYALQSDFNAYNSYVTSNSLGLPLLPIGPFDLPGMANIRITQFHGNALAGNTGPLGLYNAQNSSFFTSVSTTWTGQYWAMTFPVTGFSGFFIHTGATPLVIDLKDISAVNVGNRNRVDWSTLSEQRGDRFELERSADGTAFSKLANINAKGEASTYSYWDENPVSGINYYRLKLIHTSGNTSYSKVVSATVKGAGAFTVEAYPNPVSDVLTVKVFGAAGNNATVMITDVTGKMVKMTNVSDNKAEINMSRLAQGVYLMKYVDSKQSQTIKVNKD